MHWRNNVKRIERISGYISQAQQFITIGDAIAEDAPNYDDGALEQAQHTADAACQALGRLVDVLLVRGLIAPSEVERVIGFKLSEKNMRLLAEDQ